MAPLPCRASRQLKYIQEPPASSHHWMLCACQHGGIQLLLLVHPIRPLQHASNLHKSTAVAQTKYIAILAGAASASARRTCLLRQSCFNIQQCRCLSTPFHSTKRQQSATVQDGVLKHAKAMQCKASKTILHVAASSKQYMQLLMHTTAGKSRHVSSVQIYA